MAITGAGRILYQGYGASRVYLPTWGYLLPPRFPEIIARQLVSQIISRVGDQQIEAHQLVPQITAKED